ncbi:ABC transporter permease [Gelidibacter mesophilus]|uniref:ABC transporter permease n=1 Tax=Gelidibacter mesophilus TaxID=169050 RepID=UPI00042070FC|nr:ABC transporter permease [Gelidibacter mesophilus]
MIRNYFKIAWRNFKKNKVYSFINIFGLALGLAVTMIIGLWIVDEFNYNSHFKNSDQIAQVMQNNTINGTIETNEGLPLALEFQLRENFDDVFELVVMSSRSDERYLSVGDKVFATNGRFMQIDGPELLELEMIEGSRKGLKDSNAILLSETTAKKLFGNLSAIGKSVVSNNEYPMMVTGVYKDISTNNSFSDLHFIMPFKHWMSTQWGWLENQDSNWTYNPFFIYVKLSKNADLAALNARIKNVKKDNRSGGDSFNSELFVFPMVKWYLHSNFENGQQVGGRIENIWLFGIIGWFVLILASINFMNLSTARSEKRALEVGIRKSIGSTRIQLIYQFLSESFLVVLFAFVIAIGLVIVSLPAFNSIAGKDVVFPWSNVLFWMISVIFIGVTALISGSYPALYLSSFKPIKVLKGTFRLGTFAAVPRKILVVAQFTVSIALIIGTLIVKNQIAYSKDRPVGIESAHLIQIPSSSKNFSGKYELIRNEFMASGAVTEMGWGTSPTTSVWNYASGYDWEGKPADFQENFALMAVSFDYINTVGMKIIEGRSFSRDFATDSNAVVLNKAAVEYMGIQNPIIGKYIRHSHPGPQQVPMQIVGVVEDVINESAYDPVSPQMYQFGRGTGGFYYLKLNSENSTSKNLIRIEKVFKDNFPNLPFRYDFVDEEYAQTFVAEERIASLAGVFTVLAIVISCLGLFGLAAFVAEQRTKEIGVRKVLGASVSNLWILLSKDFILLVAIALLIATPVAYYFMSEWIEKFSYRTEISAGLFFIAGLGVLLLTVITVSFQAIKAAMANPVKSLRTE